MPLNIPQDLTLLAIHPSIPETIKAIIGPTRLQTDADELYSNINWVIMDYLVSEGYPGAAEKFAQETNLCQPADIESIRERVRIRTAIHAGKIDEALSMVNEADPEILDSNPLLHFQLLQLHLIEIIRTILDKPSQQSIIAQDFLPAIQFATEQLSPRAPTDPKYQTALERTMALMIFPPEKMAPEFKELLDVSLREKVASDVNKAILEARGERAEAKIRQLVRARAWAEAQARHARVENLPPQIPIGLDPADEMHGLAGTDGDAMVS
ncbi:hypothetical protein LTR37_008891 [Vermiconidia calcicola]|uniref:Uncharacterized protein n=1 Tax=Vermiconidia calcicola TaxID=1690605 RepID=A0ACC3N9V6_9PEZI|nr:hypothetical protein LTR37_008891 [Vermiconidia calcicola]